MIGEFDGLAMAAGVVTGARSFKVDKFGRLTGVTHQQVWRPGENEAECRKTDSTSLFGGMSYYIPRMFQTPVVEYDAATGAMTYKLVTSDSTKAAPAAEPEKPKKKPKHSMDTCQCGFYAYYDGSDDYHSRGYVSGVVEGYGETLIGSRGFRAMKARIVALKIPKSVNVRLAGLVARNYPDLPLYTSFKDMVAEHPTDVGDLAFSPETDDDFWTRDA